LDNTCYSNKVLLVIGICVGLNACVSAPSGRAKVELIDRLVAEQEFNQIQRLLGDIDTEDPEFEALVIRRRAIRPLIAQFEQYSVKHAAALQAQDLWPQALSVLENAQDKLPNSEVLQQAQDDFFRQRAIRLDAIRQQIGLLEGRNQADKTPLVDKIVAIHPTGFRTRWQHYQHDRKNHALADDLMDCGNGALQQQDLELAEACFAMVRVLTPELDVSEHLDLIAERRQILIQQQIQQQQALAQAQEQQRRREKRQQTVALKDQYRDLTAAGWLVAAKQTLAQLHLLAPDDPEALVWGRQLQAAIHNKVAQGIREGQSLYSNGKLEEALNTWQGAAVLDPDNPILQGHIARAERFIQKLERLNSNKS
jgi:tetratricopeptide (TPR) repeat protein